jgi:ankyrin repeat protein
MASSDDLFSAIGADDVAAVRALVAADPALAAARDAEGVSALMRARYRRDRGLTQAILEAAPDLDAVEAAAFGDLDRLAALVTDAEAAGTFSPDGFSLLHLAAFYGKPETTTFLLEHGAEVDVRGRGWMTGTPLHSAASARHADVARILLEAGADPDARQSGGWTPLLGAAHNGDAELAGLLLDAGADPAAVNDDGASVLGLATESGDAATQDRIRAALGG